MGENSKSFLKWIGGIIATVVAGYLIWYLTKDEKKDETPQNASVQIVSANLARLYYLPGQNIDATVEVHNSGNIIAARCFLTWKIDGSSYTSKSDQFSLNGNDTKQISVSQISPNDDRTNTYFSSITLTSDNAGSSAISLSIPVRKKINGKQFNNNFK